jgi:hypothetical protein
MFRLLAAVAGLSFLPFFLLKETFWGRKGHHKTAVYAAF